MQHLVHKKSTHRLVVIGSGAWGTTLALVASRAGTPTTLVVRDTEAARVMRAERRHPRSLPGIVIPQEVEISTDVVAALSAADIVVLAIPTQKLRQGVADIAEHVRGKVVVSAAKGIEVGTQMLPTAVVGDVLGGDSATPICALSGPNLAGEIAAGRPGTTVIAAEHMEAAVLVQNAFMGSTFRVYTSPDVIGVQMGGALKNIIAIGAGIGDGLEAGDNAKAAFMTRGIVEISRLGVAQGAEITTFAGLSGIGDLIATCSSKLSRNHQVGMRLASGASLDQILAEMTEVAEGVETTRAAMQLARQSSVEMPITEQMYHVLFEGKSPVDAVRDLMLREPRTELPDL